jgi:hypothetical protein
MDYSNIPEELRVRLFTAGYVDVNTLPNIRELSQWRVIRGECSFSSPDLNRIINALFSTFPQGEHEMLK